MQVGFEPFSAFGLKNGFKIPSDWVAPFFKEVPTEGISFSDGGAGVIQIDMIEEIPWPFKAAIIAGYSGNVKPATGTFEVGSSFDLGLEFERNDDGEWKMLITKRQDYEQPSNQLYFLTVECDGVRKELFIKVSNIFDNAPVMTAETNPCSIPVRFFLN